MSTQGSAEGKSVIRSELEPNAVGLAGALMQGVTSIAPSFSILASFVSTVILAGLVSPWAFLIAGIILILQAVNASQLAKEIPSAGGWYTWIARSLSPRAGFAAGSVISLWMPGVAVFDTAYLSYAVLQPSIKQYYGVNIPWWVYVVVGVALVIWAAYRGIKLSVKTIIITGSLEMLIMVVLAISGLASPGKGGFNFDSFKFSEFHQAPNLFLAITFGILGFLGWEAVAPLAEETKRPRRNVPLGMIGAIIVLLVFYVITSWGYLVGFGTSDLTAVTGSTGWAVVTLAQHLWGPAWFLVLFSLLNSVLATGLASFNAASRTWFSMGRSGVLPAALGRISEKRKTPNNANLVQVGVCVLCLIIDVIFGPDDVFFTWAIFLTLSVLIMYIMSNVGVVLYFTRVRRDQFNVILHLVFPVVATVVVAYVGYKSVVPLPPNPEKWAPVVTVAWFAAVAIFLIVRRLRYGKNEAWLTKAQQAMEEAATGEDSGLLAAGSSGAGVAE
jgi:amino acid transporter